MIRTHFFFFASGCLYASFFGSCLSCAGAAFLLLLALFRFCCTSTCTQPSASALSTNFRRFSFDFFFVDFFDDFLLF